MSDPLYFFLAIGIGFALLIGLIFTYLAFPFPKKLFLLLGGIAGGIQGFLLVIGIGIERLPCFLSLFFVVGSILMMLQVCWTFSELLKKRKG